MCNYCPGNGQQRRSMYIRDNFTIRILTRLMQVHSPLARIYYDAPPECIYTQHTFMECIRLSSDMPIMCPEAATSHTAPHVTSWRRMPTYFCDHIVAANHSRHRSCCGYRLWYTPSNRHYLELVGGAQETTVGVSAAPRIVPTSAKRTITLDSAAMCQRDVLCVHTADTKYEPYHRQH